MLKFLLVAVVAAALVYLTVRLLERRGGRRPAPRRNRPLLRPRSGPPSRPMGPDDDLDFLRDLDRRRRRRPVEPKPEEPPAPAPAPELSAPEEPATEPDAEAGPPPEDPDPRDTP